MESSINKVKERFDSYSPDYDANRKYLIPAMEWFYSSGIDFLSYVGESPRVLDVGAGTGIYSGFLLKRYSNADITMIDFSKNMLDEARRKFAYSENIRYVCDNYFTHDYGLEKYDIILSALSIHHLKPDEKRALYGIFCNLLDRNGEFLNADIVSRGVPDIDAKYDDQWTRFVKSSIGKNGVLIDSFDKGRELDSPSPAAVQLQWLDEAGFTVTDCPFKYFNFAVMYGRK
jgi:tRNA (cmo5U34)-methyltransferase